MASGSNGATHRWRYGLYAVMAGLVVTLAAFIGAVFTYDTSADVATAMGTITPVVGTVVGAYFGVQAGQASTAELQETAQQSIQAYESEHAARLAAEQRLQDRPTRAQPE